MKIALISPNDNNSYRAANFLTENLGLGYLHSYMEERGHSCVICDARFYNLTPEKAYEELSVHSFDVLGFSIWTREGAKWCNLFLNEYLKKNAKPFIVLGGYFPTLQPTDSFDIIPKSDVIVMGEGEEIFEELLKLYEEDSDWRGIHGIAYMDAKENKLITNPRAKLREDLNSLPWPKRYLTDKMGQYDEVYLEGSRGCVFCCTFCAIRPFIGINAGSPWRHRSARSIVDEIIHLRKQNPVLTTFRFIDSDFIGPTGHQRAEEFAELVMKEVPGIKFHAEGRAVSIPKSEEVLKKLKKAGLYRIYLGIESGSQKILNKMNKQTTVQENKDALMLLQKLDIDCSYGFIMFTPWTEEDDINDNVQFLKEMGNIQMNKFFTELLLIPNTAAYKMAKRDFPVELKENDTTYYTYPSSSTPVARIRRIGHLFENKDEQFMEKLWFIYRGIRNAKRRGLSEAKSFELQSSELFLEIFDFCWTKARNTQHTEEEIINNCIEEYTGKTHQFLDELSNRELLKISSFTDEFHY
jgi:radical SAM superfamily enzyme YgiQ (UPF0313 family)